MKFRSDALARLRRRMLYSRRLGQVAACVAVAFFAYGFYTLITYSGPMAFSYYPTALHSAASSKYEVFYSAALAEYRARNYEHCKKLAALAHEDLAARKMLKGNELLAADVLFLQGKALQMLKKKDAAIEVYEQALRLNPHHQACKYNLEMLQTPPFSSGAGSGGGSGGGKGDSKDNGTGKPGDNKAKPQNGKPENGKPIDAKPDDDESKKPSHGKPRPKI